MITYVVLLLPVAAAIAAVVIFRPIFGLYLVIISNQLEYFLPLERGLSLGRVFGGIVALAWLVNLIIRRRSKITLHHRYQWPLIVFVGVATLGVVNAKDPGTGLVMLVKTYLLVFLVALVEDLVANRQDLLRLIWVIALSYGLASVGAIIQFRQFNQGQVTLGEITGVEGAVRFAGTFSNPNNLGIMLMSGIPFLVMLIISCRSQIARVAYLGLFGTAVFSLLLSASRTHTLALFVFLTVYFATEASHGRKRIRTFLVAVALVGVLATAIFIGPNYVFTRFEEAGIDSDASTETRFLLLKKALMLASEHPLLGVGLGNSRLYRPYPGRDPHEVFAVLFGETGFLGAIAFAILVLIALWRQRQLVAKFRRNGDEFLLRLSLVIHSAFVALIAISAGNIILYQRMFWIYYGLTAVLSHPRAYRLIASPHDVRAKAGIQIPRIRLRPRHQLPQSAGTGLGQRTGFGTPGEA